MSKRIREIDTIGDVKGLPKEKPLVFLKGFAARLEMNAANVGVLDVAMRCIPSDVTGFVWDGDDYSTESYSSVTQGRSGLRRKRARKDSSFTNLGRALFQRM